jgi:hypothetical protein
MNSKPKTSLLVALCAALLAVPLGVSGASALQQAPITSGTLQPIALDTNGHDAQATFTPIDAGAKTELQVKSIKDGTWTTIATDTQRASGHTYFQIADPLEISHEYRARAGSVTTNTVTFAGPLKDKATGLATVHFNSNDGESVNSRDNYFKGEFAMKHATSSGVGSCGDVGVLQGADQALKAEMKGRGNYSWTFPKKSFTLKLDKGRNLCGMGTSKKWALVANDYDRSLLRNSTAYELGKRFSNLAWTPDETPVDLYVNGSYRGSYSLLERITATGNDSAANGGRVPIAKASAGASPDSVGYVMEWDFRKGAQNNFTAGSSGWVGLKEPEDEEYSPAMGSYINDYVDKADAAVRKAATSGEWKNYIDINSAVDYYLAMEYLKPVDGNMWASVYMYKPAGGGKLQLGPLWDFDLAAGSATRAGNVGSPSSWYLRNSLGVSAMQSSKTWFNYLNDSAEFRAAAKARWNQLDQGLHFNQFLAQRKALIGKSAAENYVKWNHGSRISEYQVIKGSWSSDVEYLRSWMESRNQWINSQLDSPSG